MTDKTVPMPPVAPSAPSRPAASAPRGQKCVVLVDDEAAYLDLLNQLLGHHLACPVSSFSDPRKALKALRKLDPGIIISDFNMPGMNGLEFIAAAAQVFPGVPAVMITGQATDLTPAQGSLAPTLKAVIKKPFRWPALAEQIARHWPRDSASPFPAR